MLPSATLWSLQKKILYRIAIRAADALESELKGKYLDDGIARFAALGKFDVCKEFALLKGDAGQAHVYRHLAQHVTSEGL